MIDILKSEVAELPAFLGIGLSEKDISRYENQLAGLRSILEIGVRTEDALVKFEELEQILVELPRWRQRGGKITKRRTKRTQINRRTKRKKKTKRKKRKQRKQRKKRTQINRTKKRTKR